MAEKSRAEIPKLTPLRCSKCGLSAPAPIVAKQGGVTACANVVACKKRQRKTAKEA